ncbi:hypothetical protein [Peribacillus deserti]|uniref:Uncharacterized protein n=1 Tax=Peribacillus deserti TaxID=673318 RepID=A0A2N5M1B3_9BACI|nr:hypothetical protein [Peribacillus deserti]PLT28158.1 hypothetical protein CUU66_19625 [Peribacillus deserti]
MKESLIIERIQWRLLMETHVNMISAMKNFTLLVFALSVPLWYLSEIFINTKKLSIILYFIPAALIPALIYGVINYFDKTLLKSSKIILFVILTMVIATLLVALKNSYSPFSESEEISMISTNGLILIFLALISNYLLAYIIHFIPFKLISRTTKIQTNLLSSFNVKLTLLFFFSPDYALAKIYKKVISSIEKKCEHTSPKDMDGYCDQCLENRRYRLKYFIKMSNWINVIFATYLMIFFLYNEVDKFGNYFIVFFLSFITFRISSRVFEISYAFYNDVVKVKSKYFIKSLPEKITVNRFVNYWRSSSIRRPERISLAIHSYVEIIFMFTILYFLITVYYANNMCGHFTTLGTVFDMCNKDRFTSYPDLFHFLLYSASVTFFNFSFPVGGFPAGWQFAHVIQVFMSIILIVLSLAIYISWQDKMTPDDIREFLLFKQSEQLEPLLKDKKALKEAHEKNTETIEKIAEEIEKVRNKYITKDFT